jgi:hypothetical protein
LALIAGVAAAALMAQGAARAARQDAAPASDSLDLLPPASSHAARPQASRPPSFHGLLGTSEAEVVARLGAPDLSRDEGKGGMWTYRLPDCALFVFFRRSPGEGLKVSGAASGPRMRGRNPPPVNECLTQAMSRHAAQPAKPVR